MEEFHSGNIQALPPQEEKDKKWHLNGRHWFDVLVVCYLAVTLGLAFGLNKPSAQPFIQSPLTDSPPGLGQSATFYSVVVACYSVGELVGALVFGSLEHLIGLKMSLLASCFVFIAGSCLYGLAFNGWMALIGRLLEGVWAGASNSLLRSYITKSTNKLNILKYFTTISFLVTFSAIGGSGLGGLMGKMNFKFGELRLTRRFDCYRAPGWILAVLATIAFLLVAFFKATEETPEEEVLAEADGLIQNIRRSNCPVTPEPKKGLRLLLDLLPILIVFFAFSVGWGTIESILTPLTRDTFGMNIEDTSIVFLIGGASQFLAFVFLALCQFRVPLKTTSYRITLVALTLCAMGTFTWIDWIAGIASSDGDNCRAHTCSFSLNASIECRANESVAVAGCQWMQNTSFGPCLTCPRVCRDPAKSLNLYQMCVAFVLLNMGFSTGRTGSGTLFAEPLKGQKSGMLMGLLVSVGAFARIVAPLFSVAVYEWDAHTTFVLMLTLFLLYFLSCALFLWKYSGT